MVRMDTAVDTGDELLLGLAAVHPDTGLGWPPYCPPVEAVDLTQSRVRKVKWTMLVFPAIGLLLWIAFLFAALVLCGIVWALCHLALGILSVIERPRQKKIAGVRRDPPQLQRRVPVRVPPRAAPPVRDRAPRPAQAPTPSDIWPKWTPAHRRYVDEELALWQEQFDALNSRK